MKKLLLCSGPRHAPYGLDGWFRVDGERGVMPDIVATLPPVPDDLRQMGPWDMIALIHGIEHFYSWDAFELIRGCFELLRPEGQLILEQPDLEKCMWYFDDPQYMKGIYGEQSYREPSLVHRYGWTPRTLTNMVRQAGFKETMIEKAIFHFPPRDFRLVAIR